MGKKALILIISILFIDQVLKIWVKTNMQIGEEIPMLGNWFYLHFLENRGMAFGMELFGGAAVGKIILSVFRIIAVFFIGYYLKQIIAKKNHILYISAISLIFAGALGNIIDSALYDIIFTYSPYENRPHGVLLGSVVDMLYFPLIDGYMPSWMPSKPISQPGWMPSLIWYNFPWANEYFLFFRPVFNIADVAISTGVGIIIVFQKKIFPKK